MFTNKPLRTYGLALAVLLSFTLSNSANASSQSNNAADIVMAKTEEVKQLELAYQIFVKEFDKSLASLKANYLAENSKGKSNQGKSTSAKEGTPAHKKSTYDNSLRVTATAYTSHVGQTDSTPNIAAWGDRLKPGMKAIAVSRDLLKEHGLKHKQKVRIKGLEGEYVVLDKMNKRWRKKIDIYMGMNKRKAFKWGRRKVEILWNQT